MGPKIALQEQAWQTGVWVRALPASAPSPPGLPPRQGSPARVCCCPKGPSEWSWGLSQLLVRTSRRLGDAGLLGRRTGLEEQVFNSSALALGQGTYHPALPRWRGRAALWLPSGNIFGARQKQEDVHSERRLLRGRRGGERLAQPCRSVLSPLVGEVTPRG